MTRRGGAVNGFFRSSGQWAVGSGQKKRGHGVSIATAPFLCSLPTAHRPPPTAYCICTYIGTGQSRRIDSRLVIGLSFFGFVNCFQPTYCTGSFLMYE